MKEQSNYSFNRSAKIASLCVTLALLLGCDPGGGLPGAPKALRSGFVPAATTLNAASNVCAASSEQAANNLPAPVLGNVGEWVEVWVDDFDGTAVDTNNWSFQTGNGCPDLCAWGNSELQLYREANATVAGGMLTIAADKPAFGPYTSARMRTIGKRDYKFGRIEARIKVPTGLGLWPAFWMLPTDSPYGETWAATGEIDIMETFNPGIDTEAQAWSFGQIDGTIWHGMVFPNMLSRGAKYDTDPTQFHTYALEWEANELRFYIDDIHYQTIGADHFRSYYWGGQNTGYVNAPPGAPFDVDFHILLNIAVGGDGPAVAPDESNVWPAEMLVDYVKVSKCYIDGEESETGGGCASNVEPSVEKPPTADIFVASQTLFEETTSDLVFCSGETPIVREMRIAVLDDAGAVTMGEATATDNSAEHGKVLDISIDNPGDYVGIAFQAEDDGTFALVGMGERGSANQHGELKFDIYIDSQNTDTAGTLSIFMEDDAAAEYDPAVACSNDGVASKDFNIADLPLDEWTTLSVQLNELVDGLNVEGITKLFGMVVNSDAHIQVDNIQVVCGHPLSDACGIQAPTSGDAFGDILNVFIDDVDPIWTNNIGAWDPDFGSNYFDGTAGRHVQWETVETGEEGHDAVVQVSFVDDAPNGVWYIQSGVGLDLSSFLEGKLVFDVKLIQGTPTGLTYKVDCRFPCGTGDQILQGFDVGSSDWQSFEIIVADLVASGLDIEKVNTPIVLFPNVGSQQGVTFQVDNVRWEKFGGEPPPPPPPEGVEPPTFIPPGSLVIYDDAPEGLWQLWNCCAPAVLTEVAADDTARGTVTQIAYSTGGTVSGYNYGGPNDAFDASSLPGGSLEFDALIVSQPDSCSQWRFKVEAENTTTPVELPLAAGRQGVEKPEGEWAHYSFPLDGLLGGFNASAFKLFMTFPEWQKADGAVIQLDNVHISPAP